MKEVTKNYIERFLQQKFEGIRILDFAGFQNRSKERNGTIKRECTFLCECLKCNSTFISNAKKIRDKRRQPCNCIREKIIRKRVLQIPFIDRLINDRYYRYKDSAKRRNIGWNLSKQIFKELSFSNCTYCGTPPNKIYLAKEFKSSLIKNDILLNGIDRINSNEDYTANNCTTACHICNMAKRDLSLEDFKIWIQRIVEFNSQKEYVD